MTIKQERRYNRLGKYRYRCNYNQASHTPRYTYYKYASIWKMSRYYRYKPLAVIKKLKSL